MRIRDPYAAPGAYRKAQLHCHTRRSDGRFAPKDSARLYHDAGYSFVCFTDHDTLTGCEDLNDDGFVALQGVEETIVRGVAPLGPHLGRLMVDRVLGVGTAAERVARTLADGGVPCLNHPSWTGNLWTGEWKAETMASLPGPFLVEIWNPHSNPDEDARRWVHALRAHGPGVMIGAVASDDCHVMAHFDRGWVAVKVPEVSAVALRAALLGGAFYASTGVEAEFGVQGDVITVRSSAEQVVVLDAESRRRAVLGGGNGRYTPAGDEGFVRIECRASLRRAWSQAFWITP